jgi:hypothetical protein
MDVRAINGRTKAHHCGWYPDRCKGRKSRIQGGWHKYGLENYQLALESTRSLFVYAQRAYSWINNGRYN